MNAGNDGQVWMTTGAADRFEVSRTLRGLLPRWLLGGNHYAQAPFLGYLEEPGSRRTRGHLALSGWVFNRGSEILRLTAAIDGGAEIDLQRGLARPDLESIFALDPRARHAGFRGSIAGEGLRLQIWAHLSTGVKRRAFAIELRPPLTARTRELLGQVARMRMRALFQRNLERAAGEQFPRVVAAGSDLFEELCRGWMEAGLEWTALELQLKGRSRRRLASRPGCLPERRPLLFVSGMFPSVMHGGGLRLFDLISELSQRHEIDLYSVYREDLDGPSLASLQPRLRSARLVRSDELRAGDAVAWLGRLGRHPGEYDAIHFEYPQSVPVIEALRPWGRRSFFTMMECLTLAKTIEIDRALAGGTTQLTGAAVGFVESFAVERDALERTDRGIAVTDVDADFAQRCFGDPRPLVVPTCVSDHEIRRHLQPGLDDDDPRSLGQTALFVGYYDHYPNRDALAWYLSEIHPRVSARLPHYRLRVVGRGDPGQARVRWADDPQVEWIGPVDELVPQLRAARIGLAPLISGAGIRGKINQHAAAGRPSVSTSIGALGLPYRNGESILIADTPAAFADATVRLLADDLSWHRLRAGCRQIVDQHFSWQRVAAHLEELYVD